MSWLGLIPYLLALAIGAGAAWPVARAPLQADIAELRKTNADLREANAETARLAALAAAAKLQRAQATGDAASARLAAALAANSQLTQEKKHALKAATDGRACLSERALRLLNGAPGLTVAAPAAGLPAPAGQPAAAGGITATDTDIAGWALDAGKQHEACRQQLAELIGWINDNAPATQEPRGGPKQ